MDVPQLEATLKFELIHLEHAVPDELVPDHREPHQGRRRHAAAAASRPRRRRAFGGAEKPEPKIIADPRTNSIVVYAVESDMTKIKYLVSALDSEVKEPESNIRVYMLKNTNAEDLVEVLQQIIGYRLGLARGSRPAAAAGSAARRARPRLDREPEDAARSSRSSRTRTTTPS